MSGVGDPESELPLDSTSSDTVTNLAPDSSVTPTSSISADQPVDIGSQSVKEAGQDVVKDQENSDNPPTVGPAISEADMKILQKLLLSRPKTRPENPNVGEAAEKAYDDHRTSLWAVYDKLSSKLIDDTYDRRPIRHTAIPFLWGMVDHFTALEERIKKLEDGSGTSGKSNKKADEATEVVTAENLTVRFYDSSGHVDKNGVYQDIHNGAEKGTYMCDEDPKYLIRALYTRLKEEVAPAQVGDEVLEPEPDDVEIVSFGILSEPLSAYFEKLLNLEFDNRNLVKVGKPFRPIIRHYKDLREQLARLEQKYGAGTGQEQPHTPQRTPSQLLHVSMDQPARSPSPSPLPQDKDKDATPSFDRPSAIPHFQVLLSFVDKYLGKQIRLFDRIRSGEEDRVAFKDLWMVYDMKDVIYSPRKDYDQKVFKNTVDDTPHRQVKRHSSQAYQVVSTGGGMPFEKTVTSTATRKDTDSLTSQDVAERVKDILKADQNKANTARNSYTQLSVYCFYVDFNGNEYGIVREVFVFKPYEGQMDVRNLQAFPIRYTSTKIQDSLLERGRQFLSVTKTSHMQYEGLTAATAGVREEINSPVVVDMKMAFESEPLGIDNPKFSSPAGLLLPLDVGEAIDLYGRPECYNQWCFDRGCQEGSMYMLTQFAGRTQTTDNEIKPVLEEYEQIKQEGDEGLGKFTALMEKHSLTKLLPGVVPGFALRNRKWLLLDLSNLCEVKQRNEWKNLVLPSGHQKMVQAMVEGYANGMDATKEGTKIRMDLVSGKGEGCIILLHGVPGVGKTSTAECVAAHTNKPLYPITCGDIGVTPETVESNMERHFKLAHKWGCVLLLDEADVFLAKRDQRDVTRNGLVSVFLRILEYYSGILFLTTNRVGAIDDAFRSRLHLQLYYPKLTIKQTKRIFKKNFDQINNLNQDRIKSGVQPFDYDDNQRKVIAWAEKNFETLGWNGRQIRNGFQSVLALAEFGAKKYNIKHKTVSQPKVTLELFKLVAKTSLEFTKYLRETHGFDEDVLAQRERIRADPEEFTSSFNKKSQPDEPRLEDPSELSSDEDSSDQSERDGSRLNEDSDDSEESDEPKKKKGKGKGGKKSSEGKSPKKKSAGGKGKGSGKKSKRDKKDESEDDESESD